MDPVVYFTGIVIPRVFSCNLTVNSPMLKFGFISTENYPGFYSAGTTCIYTFHGLGNERVVIEFNDFDLATSVSSTR